MSIYYWSCIECGGFDFIEQYDNLSDIIVSYRMVTYCFNYIFNRWDKHRTHIRLLTGAIYRHDFMDIQKLDLRSAARSEGIIQHITELGVHITKKKSGNRRMLFIAIMCARGFIVVVCCYCSVLLYFCCM